MEITLEIKKEDILIDNYVDIYNCPITKALHRAGFPSAFECGGEIIGLSKNELSSNDNTSYLELRLKLHGMYKFFSHTPKSYLEEAVPIPVKTFTHTLIF